MRATPIVFAAAVVGVLTVTLSADAGTTATPEIRRIRAHFDSVIVELQQRDVSELTSRQRRARADIVSTLTRYRDRGVFPHNYDFAAPTPYFIDRKTGTRCAVAHLLESTGRRDIVLRVAAMDNNVWVAELAGDTALATWLDQHGLTLAEAARIQVPYMGEPDDVVVAPPPSARSFNTASTATVGTSALIGALNVWANRDGHSRLGNVVGVTSGLASLGMGVAGIASPGRSESVGAANLVTGALNVFISTRGILRNRRIAEQREAQLNVVPTVSLNEGAGVAVSFRF
jgi:hypothetical protein